MNTKKILLATAVALTLCSTAARATTISIWQGSKRFATWSDVLHVDGSRFAGLKADDVVVLAITAVDGAQLQVSYGAAWTCFEGLSALSVRGNHSMVVTAPMAAQLRQGIHVKGVNFTLTAIVAHSNDAPYATRSSDLFGWNALLTSGATQGSACTLGLEPYGGAGWYWPATADLSGYGGVAVQLMVPAAEALTVQLLCDAAKVRSAQIAQGATQCRLALGAACTKAYSLNFVSERAQTVVLGSVDLTDRQGNVVASAIVPAEGGNGAGDGGGTTAVFSLAGVRLGQPGRGVSIVRTKTEGGRTRVRKVAR